MVRSIGLLAVLFCADFVPCSALGQAADAGGYIVDPIDDSQRGQMSKIRAMFTKGAFGVGEEAAFDKFYETYALARWSQPTNRHKLTAYRKELSTHLLQAKSGPVHDHLRDLALKKLKTMASKNYHPAVQVNAMLMIGELNQVEDPRPADIPKPYATALENVLLPAVKAPTLPDAVKVAALAGIARHAKLGAPMPPAVQAEMIKLVETKTASGPSADGQAWMRVQAVRVLSAMGSPGTNGAVPNAIARMVNDGELRLSARCVAARALGQLRYGGDGWANAGAAVGLLRQLALDACDAEKDEVLQRRLAFHLSGISTALDRIGPLVGGESGPQLVAGLKASLEALEEILKDESLDAPTLNERVGQEADKIRGLTP